MIKDGDVENTSICLLPVFISYLFFVCFRPAPSAGATGTAATHGGTNGVSATETVTRKVSACLHIY